MSYREKIAWLTLIAMAITYGPYFAAAARTNPSASLPDLHLLGLCAVTIVAEAAILAAGRIVLALREPKSERTPPDERDRAIECRSLGSAYYVLIVGMLLVGCVMPFKASGWAIINAALFMIVAAEVVHYGVVVWSYRRQA